MKRLQQALWAGILLAPALAVGAVLGTAPDSMVLEHRYTIPVTPAEAWAVLIHPERYWPDDHTWSGKAANMSLVAEAGGCFCERWDGGSAEHGRVIMAQPGRLLRFRGSLGPFQETAASGVLTVVLSAVDGGTEAVVTYRLSGDPSHGLDKAAPVVDRVVGQQFGNFAELAGRKGP